MIKRHFISVLPALLIFSLLLTSLVNGQTNIQRKNLNNSAQTEKRFESTQVYLEDLSQEAEEGKIQPTEGLEAETEKLVNILASKDKKGTILTDKYGTKRFATVENLAVRLAANNVPASLRGKRILKLNLTQIVNDSKGEQDLSERLNAVLKFVESLKEQAVLFVEDFSSFGQYNPLFGNPIAEKLRESLANGNIRVYQRGNGRRIRRADRFGHLLKSSFRKIDLNEGAENSEDDFVGDKLSPDLRELVANADPNQMVKVILQSDDINNAELRKILRQNNVKIENEAKSLNMLVVDLPVRAAEEIAAVRGAKHLSLDRELKLLGHIETTTGTTLVRTIQQGMNVGLLGTTVLNTSTQLDGTGIGIAIVDSGVRDDHRSFVNESGTKRITIKVDFTGDNNLTEDRFGHGTHVASLAAGSGGQNLNLADGLYLDNYQGIAPNAKIINVRVLDREGLGSTARLITALDWIYNNRATYNIRVVNLSLGSPAIESWRNDPLCRAVRKLTDAGVVVVAAAGNNGKNASGQKIYGAIHSPGNDPTVITVGATNTFGTDARNDEAIATYSSRGPTRSFWTDTANVKALRQSYQTRFGRARQSDNRRAVQRQ